MPSQRNQPRHHRSGFFGHSGFTIVEMLIVIVVIAILAAVVLIAYNGVKNRAVDSMLKSSLSSAAQKLETHNVTHGAYPDLLSAIGVANTDAVHYQYDGPDTENTYCLSATSPQSTSISYHARSGNTASQPGVCEGHIGPGEEEGEETFSFARTVHGDGPLGLTVHVGEEWTAAEISWSPQAGAQKYEVQSRNPDDSSSNYNAFRYRLAADGSGYTTTAGAQNYSGIIPASTTSLAWTNASAGIPASTGQMFEYRLRYQLSDGSYSDWDTAQLSHPIQSADDLRAPTGLTVTPNGSFTNVTISWNAVKEFSPRMGQVWVEVQSRNPDDSTSNYNTFRYRLMADGSNSTTTANAQNFSGRIPHSTTSLVWTNANAGAPTSTGQIFEYRIRVRAEGERTFQTEWSDVVRATYPLQGDSDIPSISNFTVTPNPSFTNVTLSWNQVPNFAPNMSQVWVEVQSRNPANSTSSYNTFRYRLIADGSSDTAVASAQNYSGRIAYSTTSLVWTNANAGVPTSTGQIFEYRARIRAQGEKTFSGNWTNVVTATYPIQADADIPNISGFTVVPNGGFTNVTISWNQVPNFAPNMGQVWVEVQSRNPANGSSNYNTFRYRLAADGSGYATAAGAQNYSGLISPSTTSLTWTNANAGVPTTPGQTFEYRARIRAQGESTYYGNWSPTVQVAH